MKNKREISIIALVTLTCVGIKFTKDFIDNDLINYAILAGSLSLVLTLTSIMYIINTRSEKAIYKNFIKSTLRTYDAILVKTLDLPSLKGKNIVRVNKFSDLIDAQIEMKKPIYYKEFNDYTVFILIDNEEACVTIVRLNDNTPCEYLHILEEAINSNLASDTDKSLLEDIEKTTIIRLDNLKSFKVSPIRKEKVKEVTPKKYSIKKSNIHCTLDDNTETEVLIETIKDFVKVLDNNNKMKNITIRTDEYKFILKDTDDNVLEKFEETLLKELEKTGNTIQERTEYLES